MLKKYSELQVGDVVKIQGDVLEVIYKDNEKIYFSDGTSGGIKYTYKVEVLSSKSEKKEEWKPKNGEKYFFVRLDFMDVAENTYEEGYEYDEIDIENHNYFRTREQAESALEKVKELLKSIKDNG